MAAEDCAQEAFLEAAARVKAGALDNPACFLGYLRTIAYRIYVSWLQQRGRDVDEGEGEGLSRWVADRRPGPEDGLMEEEKRRIALEVLKGMNPRERELLVRFYLLGQAATTVCREMGLTADQFRLMKWRAKARFGQLGQRRLRPRLVPGTVRENVA